MLSTEELRAEARRLRDAVQNVSDPEMKRELATRALELAERAEAIAKSQKDPEIIRANVERYRQMLAAGIDDVLQKRIVEEMLSDAEQMLERTKHKA